MIRKTRARALVSVVLAVTAVVGCSDSKSDSKQPQLKGTPDPNIKGPITPGGGPNAKPAQAAAPVK